GAYGFSAGGAYGAAAGDAAAAAGRGATGDGAAAGRGGAAGVVACGAAAGSVFGGVTLKLSPQRAQRARTPCGGMRSGFTRKTVWQCGQRMFMTQSWPRVHPC